MALQIAPIKASRRKILPNLNKPAYTEKSRAVRKVGTKRTALVNPRTARKVAAQKTSRQIARNVYDQQKIFKDTYEGVIDLKRGEKLKEGIEALARRAEDVSEEQRYKLSQMDPANLEKMYESNDLIFEVYFQYNQSPEGAKMLDSKNSDVQFLLDQYEKIYGALPE